MSAAVKVCSSRDSFSTTSGVLRNDGRVEREAHAHGGLAERHRGQRRRVGELRAVADLDVDDREVLRDGRRDDEPLAAEDDCGRLMTSTAPMPGMMGGDGRLVVSPMRYLKSSFL